MLDNQGYTHTRSCTRPRARTVTHTHTDNHQESLHDDPPTVVLMSRRSRDKYKKYDTARNAEDTFNDLTTIWWRMSGNLSNIPSLNRCNVMGTFPNFYSFTVKRAHYFYRDIVFKLRAEPTWFPTMSDTQSMSCRPEVLLRRDVQGYCDTLENSVSYCNLMWLHRFPYFFT